MATILAKPAGPGTLAAHTAAIPPTPMGASSS